jgi:hypothetical protein
MKGPAAVRLVVLFLISTLHAIGQDAPAGVRAEIDVQKTLFLKFTVTSAARSRVTLDKYRLPWANVHSVVLAAVTRSGQSLQRDMPIDDPLNQRVSLDAGESLSGTIDLRKAFRGLESTLEKEDVNLFWAYDAPKELGINDHWNGWILLRRRH